MSPEERIEQLETALVYKQAQLEELRKEHDKLTEDYTKLRRKIIYIQNTPGYSGEILNIHLQISPALYFSLDPTVRRNYIEDAFNWFIKQIQDHLIPNI